jgi:hypothetical protein
MKCPHCEYKNGWSPEKLDVVRGEHGEFYEVSNDIKMEREDKGSYHRRTETRSLIGCPSCNKIFMGESC